MTFCAQGPAQMWPDYRRCFFSLFLSTGENNRSVVAERRSESGRRSLYHLSQVVASETITFSFFFPGCNETSRESNQICVTFPEP